jgi:glycine/D-amino acid oxidase-like deaminating enzyme
VDYKEAIDQLEEMIRKAKSVPLSASAVIPRDEALALVHMLRDALPKEHEQAQEILSDREGMMAEARAAAQKLVDQARAERARLVSRTELVQAAQAEAERVVQEAETASGKLKHQADDYVDAKLANFEILLNKTLKTVHRGREQLRHRLEAAQDEVAPLNLEDSGEISGEIPLEPPPA